MVFKNINYGLWFYRLPNHFSRCQDVKMLHNNIFWTIEEMWSKVDIEDEKKQHNAFEKALGFQTLIGWQYYGYSHRVKPNDF